MNKKIAQLEVSLLLKALESPLNAGTQLRRFRRIHIHKKR